MSTLEYSVLSATPGATNFGVENIKNRSREARGTYWKVYNSSASILIKLREKSLVSCLTFKNGGTSEITVEVGLSKSKKKMIAAARSMVLSHNSIQRLCLGHIPARYIRLQCQARGSPHVSLKSLVVEGQPESIALRFLPSKLVGLILDRTEVNLYQPKDDEDRKPASRGNLMNKKCSK